TSSRRRYSIARSAFREYKLCQSPTEGFGRRNPSDSGSEGRASILGSLPVGLLGGQPLSRGRQIQSRPASGEVKKLRSRQGAPRDRSRLPFWPPIPGRIDAVSPRRKAAATLRPGFLGGALPS